MNQNKHTNRRKKQPKQQNTQTNTQNMSKIVNRLDNMQLEIQKSRRVNRARNRNVRAMVVNPMVGPQIGFNRPNDVHMIMSQMGNTIEGQRWAMTALDPCGPIPDNLGIPDSSGAPVATPAYRGSYVISYDATMFQVAPANPSPNYDIQIMNVPIPEIAFLYRIRDIASDTWSRVRVVRTDGMALPPIGQVNPDIGTTLKRLGYGKVRLSGVGYTYMHDCASNSDMGRVTSGQIECLESVVTGFTYAGPANGTSAYKIQAADNSVQTSYRFPNSSAFLVNGCPNVYQAEAKDGAYVPIKFTGAVSAQQYRNTGEFAYDTVTDGNGNVLIAPDTYMLAYFSDSPVSQGAQSANLGVFEDPSSGVGQYGLIAGSPTFTTTGFQLFNIHPYVTEPTDMLTAVTFFEGLSSGYSGTGATVSVGAAASIRVKSRLYIEAISTGAGAISPYVHKSPILDQRAIDVVATVGQVSADAFPASYNSLGTILSSIWSGIKSVATPLLTIGSKLPVVGPFASAGLMGINAVDKIRNLIRGPAADYQEHDLD